MRTSSATHGVTRGGGIGNASYARAAAGWIASHAGALSAYGMH